MQGPTKGQFVWEISTPRVQVGAENQRFVRTAQEIGRLERVELSDLEMAYRIERLKKLRATVFESSTYLADKEAKGWWKSILARCSDARSLSMAEYVKKYTELSWYAYVIVASESDRCRRVSQKRNQHWSLVIGLQQLVGLEAVSSEGHFKKDSPQLNMTVQKDQGVGSQIIEQSRVSVVPTEGTSGARQKGVVGKLRQQGKVYSMTNKKRGMHQTLLLLNRMLEPLSEGLAIYTPVGDVLFVNEVLRNCEVLVEGISMLMELIPLELQRLDIILGMDFLFAHYASMDCHRKEVVFRKPSFAEVDFRGSRKVVPRSLILVLKAEKLLRKDCILFLAHVVVVQREKLKPEDVLVVKEFLDVFLDDLSGLPSDREIEFTIELLQGTTLIS
ncbi:Gag protease polyprotein-like protein [Cucumis melo var. makuwa]|uniref:Gag protease polyprotein-like protein n=1 Tax=Cucumis melo var. makuwa TaxID=1194695 RepID=A0A5A7TZD2_CUCMM|nr:Gag protease polyprotein-like protein [Cucumis melo var. makuwa]